MTQLPATPEYDLLRERYVERWALSVCRSPTFIQSLKAYHIDPTITVDSPKGKSMTISASEVYAARKRFFVTLDLEQDLCRMTVVGDILVELFQDWLLHEYSDRYHYIVTHAQHKWLKQIIILVMARHLMEQKYELYIDLEKQTFADTWARTEMIRLQLLSGLPAQFARMVHHIIQDPEQKQALIDQFHSDLDIRMRGHLLSIPDPLPPLASGATLPFALLSQGEGSAHE
jgi:hypothetical protein